MPYTETPVGLEGCRLGLQAAPALARLQEGTERLSTGFVELDRALGGGIPIPTLGILGAKPKCGKSTFLLQIVSHIVLGGGYAYLVDRENGLDRLLKRVMCSNSMTDPDKLGTFFVPTDPWKRTEALVLEGSLGKRLFVETQKNFDWHLLENRIRELKQMAGDLPCIVVLDSLQKLPMNLQDRRAGVDGWIRALEHLRDRYRIVILLASELKRPAQGQNYKPSETALKESGDVEYSADLVLTFDRQENPNDDFITEKPPQPAVLRVLFNRDGQTGRVADYRLVYPYHKIQEEPRPYYEGLRRAHLAAVPSVESGSEG